MYTFRIILPPGLKININLITQGFEDLLQEQQINWWMNYCLPVSELQTDKHRTNPGRNNVVWPDLDEPPL